MKIARITILIVAKVSCPTTGIINIMNVVVGIATPRMIGSAHGGRVVGQVAAAAVAVAVAAAGVVAVAVAAVAAALGPVLVTCTSQSSHHAFVSPVVVVAFRNKYQVVVAVALGAAAKKNEKSPSAPILVDSSSLPSGLRFLATFGSTRGTVYKGLVK